MKMHRLPESLVARGIAVSVKQGTYRAEFIQYNAEGVATVVPLGPYRPNWTDAVRDASGERRQCKS